MIAVAITIRGSRRSDACFDAQPAAPPQDDGEQRRADPARQRDRASDPDMAVMGKQQQRADRPRSRARTAPHTSACGCPHGRTTPRRALFPASGPAGPAEIAASAAATMAVSRGPKAPRSNRPPAIASESTANPVAAGSESASASSSARDCEAAVGVAVAAAQARRDGRHHHRGDRDRDDAERQLVEAVGIIEPRHRGLGRRGDHRPRHQLELRDAAGEHPRERLDEKAPHRRRGREREPPRPLLGPHPGDSRRR